ncbi:uncharacterized protein BDZ99DRAFT_457117 [Mytilinidion resinicola]|uniref:DNA repair protein Rad26 n=1 Tax=Mytilinidion resinicola TaxID=574789 RepID=A0A6A6Z8M7_9PEZI|nr:uncharacterized protein BDZ99DRAFT_457117 [Mytilinidion resinicola]KAF2817380.1 hypothetical protein BDZ99DRAFT_457117 [Mytilinidion resinicola]
MDVHVEAQEVGPAANELRERIQELEREKERLLKSVEEAKSAAMSKAGEIAIVRSKHDKVTKEYERRISVMQQAHADVVAKQKAELEKTKKDREVIETNNLFLEHDLARDAAKAKQTKKNLKDGAAVKAKAGPVSQAVTPKRHNKVLPFRDGFDDDDIVLVSPSKARDRPKAATPKQGGKRKRPVMDQSPIKPLQLSEPREKAKPPVVHESLNQQLHLALLAKLEKDEHRFEFMRRLLNHRPRTGHERTFESLTQYAFPSNPSKMLSSLVYDDLATCTPESHVEDFAQKFCYIFFDLWEQCLKETFYTPLYLLVDTIRFILATEKMGTAIAITEKALPLILASVDLVAIPIARASTNPAFISDRDAPPQGNLRSKINVLDCLSLLHTIATSCVTSSEAISKFWQCVPNDFVLLMLMKAQPLDQIMLMLRILSTSALPGTVGAIVPVDSGPDQQIKRETDTIDRLTILLFETPEPLQESTKSSAYDPPSICELRIQVLRVLGGLCVHQYGGRVLAKHRHCIGRLVRFMHDQIDALYNYRTLTHSAIVDSINISMRILYHLATSFPDEVDMRARLSVIQGGIHKHLVALTRLAFSDAIVLEAGIEDEVVDAAHQLLEEYLSPEEGEALLQVFSSGRSVG